MIELKVLYKPESTCEKVEIFGIVYAQFVNGPRVYVVESIEESERDENSLTFKEITEDGLEIHHLLHKCVYTEINDVVHINCRFHSEEYIENKKG